jgi:integrase
LTGMRPGEVLSMRGRDLNLSGTVWEYVPQSHKTQHHRRARTVFLGPRAQEVIRPFLNPDLQAYLFSPQEAVKEHYERRTALRRVPSNCGNRSGTRRRTNPKRCAGARYDGDAYRVAIQRACERAFEMPADLRSPRRGLVQLPETERASELARRKESARIWRAENSWHPHQLRHNAATTIRREAGIETARCVLGHSSVGMAELYAEMDAARARETMALVG